MSCKKRPLCDTKHSENMHTVEIINDTLFTIQLMFHRPKISGLYGYHRREQSWHINEGGSVPAQTSTRCPWFYLVSKCRDNTTNYAIGVSFHTHSNAPSINHSISRRSIALHSVVKQEIHP